MASPFLYQIDDRLSLAELTAARLDGHLVELGEAYIPADAVETLGLRAGLVVGRAPIENRAGLMVGRAPSRKPRNWPRAGL